MGKLSLWRELVLALGLTACHASEPAPEIDPAVWKEARNNEEASIEKAVNSPTVNEPILEEDYHYNEADREKYQSWIDETIEYSERTEKAVIIVDKADFRLKLYTKGELIKSFPIELGHNPFDDKKREGDRTTPEGRYHVSAVKPVSKFYKALRINYPNKKDAEEFRELKRSGEIPPDARIGGEIEIHGDGSGASPRYNGTNWTFGCIALSNSHMNELFPHVKNGTPVTVVRYDSAKIEGSNAPITFDTFETAERSFAAPNPANAVPKYVLEPIIVKSGSN